MHFYAPPRFCLQFTLRTFYANVLSIDDFTESFYQKFFLCVCSHNCLLSGVATTIFVIFYSDNGVFTTQNGVELYETPLVLL